MGPGEDGRTDGELDTDLDPFLARDGDPTMSHDIYDDEM
jgi:hypothetical protein